MQFQAALLLLSLFPPQRTNQWRDGNSRPRDPCRLGEPGSSLGDEAQDDDKDVRDVLRVTVADDDRLSLVWASFVYCSSPFFFFFFNASVSPVGNRALCVDSLHSFVPAGKRKISSAPPAAEPARSLDCCCCLEKRNSVLDLCLLPCVCSDDAVVSSAHDPSRPQCARARHRLRRPPPPQPRQQQQPGCPVTPRPRRPPSRGSTGRGRAGC